MVTGSSPIDGQGNEDRDLKLNSVLIGGAAGKNSLICVAKQMSCCFCLLGLLHRTKSHLHLLYITLDVSHFPGLVAFKLFLEGCEQLFYSPFKCRYLLNFLFFIVEIIWGM